MSYEKGVSTNGKGKKRGPRKGKEVRLTRSIRIEPTKRDMIETRHGSVQKWFDMKLEEELGDVIDVEIV